MSDPTISYIISRSNEVLVLKGRQWWIHRHGRWSRGHLEESNHEHEALLKRYRGDTVVGGLYILLRAGSRCP